MVQYAYTGIPSHPSGQITFVICSMIVTRLVGAIPAVFRRSRLLKYSPEVHEASFVLPKFASDRLKAAKRDPAKALFHL